MTGIIAMSRTVEYDYMKAKMTEVTTILIFFFNKFFSTMCD